MAKWSSYFGNEPPHSKSELHLAIRVYFSVHWDYVWETGMRVSI